MRDCLFFVDSYRTVAFGLWTIFNIIKLVNLPLDPMCSARKGKETDLLASFFTRGREAGSGRVTDPASKLG